MAKERLEPEVVKIIEHISKGDNFLLSGGAGSGKTYSLVHVIKEVINNFPTAKVACMTYTNAAVKEIEERVNHSNLSVSTIHDFLWDNIKSFQKELKKSLIALINDENSKIKNPEDKPIDDTYFNGLENGIKYKEYIRIKDGIISHDEVLELANYMFRSYPLLCDIIKDKFKFILIDEYQDTSPLVVEIFLVHLAQSKKQNTIGFFGDAMQSIYEDGIGDLKKYIDLNIVKEVQKKQNRRNPFYVINLANKLRTDGLEQEPSSDENAPNMKDGEIKNGRIKFIYSSTTDVSGIKGLSYFDGWESDNSKELNLTHNLIATKAGFPELMEIYDNDPILRLKKDILDRLKKDKTIVGENSTFDEIVDLLQLRNIKKQLKKDIIMQDDSTLELYNQVKSLPFSVVRKIYLDKDMLIDDKKQDEDDENRKGSKRDDIIKHLFKIQRVLHLYRQKKYNDFIRMTEFKIMSVDNKKELQEIIAKIEKMSDQTIEKVIDYANDSGICRKDDKFNRYLDENSYIYNRVKKVKYKEFQHLYDYLEGFTPFSTQHKTKGAEYDNVLVILDNGGWNNYNFEYLFNDKIFSILDKGKQNSYPRILSRTQKIFYVCCTRAKENLVVFYQNPSPEVISKAIEWFGTENVHKH